MQLLHRQIQACRPLGTMDEREFAVLELSQDLSGILSGAEGGLESDVGAVQSALNALTLRIAVATGNAHAWVILHMISSHSGSNCILSGAKEDR